MNRTEHMTQGEEQGDAWLEALDFMARNSITVSKVFRLRDGVYISSVRLSISAGSFDGHGEGKTPVGALMAAIADAKTMGGMQ